MKYIDAEKLIVEIKGLQCEQGFETGEKERGYQSAIKDILNIITPLQQEQSELDLKKFTEKIKTYQERYKYPESTSIKAAMAFMARTFYQYPNVARMWYDSLPKATMD